MFKNISIYKKFENTYNINSFLYRLSKIPIIKNIITEDTYSNTADKKVFSLFINIYSFIRSLLIKIIYYSIIYSSIIFFFKENQESSFIHILIILTILGIFINTSLFVPGKRNYYSINLLGMDAKIYTFSSLISKFIFTFLLNGICLIVLKYIIGYSYIYVLILSLFTSFCRILSEVFGLFYYKTKGDILINNSRDYFTLVTILILCAYLLPYLNITMDFNIVIIIFIISIILTLISIVYLKNISDYKIIYKRMSTKSSIGLDDKKISMASIYEVSKKDIKIDEKKLKGKKGYDYFNTIFFLRHKKILMTSAKNYSLILLILSIGICLYISIHPEYKAFAYNAINNNFTWTLIIMYFLNRGAIVTGAMFYNCDRSMLKYNFYREENAIINNFKTRVKTVIKVNIIPAIVFSLGIISILFLTGKQIPLITYLMIFISILIMSILFSIHYLVIYYLLQPYDEDMSMKSMSYNVISFLTYYICYLCTTHTFSIMNFTIFVTIISIIYILISLILVKKKAPFTFRLK